MVSCQRPADNYAPAAEFSAILNQGRRFFLEESLQFALFLRRRVWYTDLDYVDCVFLQGVPSGHAVPARMDGAPGPPRPAMKLQPRGV
jgi:hypothetical protein